MVTPGVGGGTVDVDVHDVDFRVRILQQRRADKDVIEDLRVADVHERISLGQRHAIDQVRQPRDLGESENRWSKLVLVQVSQNDDRGIGIRGENAGGEPSDDLCLTCPLALGVLHRWLVGAEERVVATLRFEVIYDQEKGLATEADFCCQ